MPGISAFRVPGVPADRDIQLFYNTKRYNLAVALRGSNGNDSGLTYSAQPTNHKGIVVDTTQLDTTVSNGMRLIVGLTFPELPPGQTDYDDYDVSIISPMYLPVAKTNTNNKAVAVCSNGNTAWVFYLVGSDDLSRKLAYRVILGAFAESTVQNIPSILNGSSLVAVYNPFKGAAFVYYQGKDDNTYIYEFNQDTEGATHISSTNDSVPGTAISLAYAVEDKRLYMYYTDKAYKLRRISRPFDSDAKWSSSSEIKGVGVSVSAGSQLGIVADPNKRVNHIFFVAKNDTESTFSYFTDSWITG